MAGLHKGDIYIDSQHILQRITRRTTMWILLLPTMLAMVQAGLLTLIFTAGWQKSIINPNPHGWVAKTAFLKTEIRLGWLMKILKNKKCLVKYLSKFCSFSFY
jgi:hypothetical protein